MPSFRGITVSLQSQYDILTIPEYPSSSSDDLPHIPRTDRDNSSLSLSRSSTGSGRSDCSEPPLVEVYSPVYPASQFWIAYTVTPPTQVEDRDRQLKFMYFRLFINDRCVTSWGVGAKNEWKGKTMWGLVDGGMDHKGRQQVERRALFFTRMGDDAEEAKERSEEGVFEVRVFRSIGRMRATKEVGELDKQCTAGGAVNFVDFGQLKRKEPQKFYRYALMDPIDEPYVTFKYHLCTSDQLDALGLRKGTSKDTYTTAAEEVDVEKASLSSSSSSSQASSSSTITSQQGSVIYRPYTSTAIESLRHFFSPSPDQRLKPLPPSPSPSPPFKRTALEGSLLQSAPNGGNDDDGSRQWAVRTPSPTKADRMQSESPPLEGKKRTGRGGVLRGVLNSVLRRKGRG